jgi:cytoskeleton protein RodZ
VLGAERQARGWSVEYVASHLKLAVRQIHALEEGRYDALPGAVVTRGFIRIYAKMLGIDSAALVAALPVDTAAAQVRPSRTLSTPFSESSLPLRGRSELPVARLAWLAVGVLVIAGIFGAARYGAWENIKHSSLLQRLHIGTASAEAATPASDSPEPGAAPVAVADSENAMPPEAVSETSNVAPAAAQAAPVAAGTASATLAASTAAPAPAVKPAVAPVAAAALSPASPAPAPATTATDAAPAVAGANPLRLTIRQDSWVEIRRADKSAMVSRILKAGTTESFDIAGPVSVTIGNASGVDATLRGKALDLTSTTGSNVARLNLN